MLEKVICLKKKFIKNNHPWIRKNLISGKKFLNFYGDIVTVLDNKGIFYGRGYCNAKSLISARIMTFKDEPLNEDFFKSKISAAFEKRKPLLKNTNAYRLVFSEADSLPGFIVDIYDKTAVLQVFTKGAEKLKSIFIQSLKNVVPADYIFEKSDSAERKKEGLIGIKKWHTPQGSDVIKIYEGDFKFYVDIVNGHKTGFYLDQKKSRQGMKFISKNKKVLDLFCYTGGFSIASAVSGAECVTCVDIKQQWLDMAKKNAELNRVSEKMRFVKKDAFSIMDDYIENKTFFDIIIIDPPSFVKTKKNLPSALAGYKKIHSKALKILNKNGILCTFSCSYHISNELFARMLKDVSCAQARKYQILKRCHQAQDHPAISYIPQTNYLKGYFLKFE